MDNSAGAKLFKALHRTIHVKSEEFCSIRTHPKSEGANLHLA